jgi:branched-chain amino acid transport system permease protein
MNRRTAALAAAGLVVLAFPLAVHSPYLLHIAVITGIYVVLAQSLNLVLGYCGLLSLATPAFFGIGAYVATLLALRTGWDTAATLALAAAGGLVAGVAIGFPSLRVSRHAFVIVTLAATLLLQLVALNWEDVTRGSLGLPNIPAARFLGIAVVERVQWYYAAVFAAICAVALTWLVVSSRYGRAMLAVRDNEQLALACGIDVFGTRLFAFCVSGALAAVAGGLYAHFITYIDPGVFGFSVTETLLIMVILGGAGTLWGPAAGAVIFTALPEALRLTPELRSLIYGAILLAIVLYQPRRLLG